MIDAVGLQQILSDSRVCCAVYSGELRGISIDSRVIGEGYCFVAIAGAQQDGARFIKDAVARGARAIVAGPGVWETIGEKISSPLVWIEVASPRRAAAQLASAWHGNPGQRLLCVGITGTNGKTSTAFFLRHILETAGCKSGLIGTIWHDQGRERIVASRTTPDALRMQSLLAEMAANDCSHAVMEVSSHALVQERVKEIPFYAALFTNLTQDHLDYHTDMEQYFAAKALLFRELAADSRAVINVDDVWGRRLLSLTAAQVLPYGLHAANAAVRAVDIMLTRQGMSARIKTPAGSFAVQAGLIGRHNVYNMLAAVAAAHALDIELSAVARACNSMPQVPGRLERIETTAAADVFVDYAHTDDALQQVLTALRELNPRTLITVFGCGGDRDQGKRPLMGAVADRLSDRVILTSDNPRNEDPEQIISDIRSGCSPDSTAVEIVTDRKQAIGQALQLAQAGDIVLIAGKGHEATQVFRDRTVNFDDRAMVRELAGDSDAVAA